MWRWHLMKQTTPPGRGIWRPHPQAEKRSTPIRSKHQSAARIMACWWPDRLTNQSGKQLSRESGCAAVEERKREDTPTSGKQVSGGRYWRPQPRAETLSKPLRSAAGYPNNRAAMRERRDTPASAPLERTGESTVWPHLRVETLSPGHATKEKTAAAAEGGPCRSIESVRAVGRKWRLAVSSGRRVVCVQSVVLRV